MHETDIVFYICSQVGFIHSMKSGTSVFCKDNRMKFLHLGDFHIGKSIGEFDLIGSSLFKARDIFICAKYKGEVMTKRSEKPMTGT